MDSLTDQLSQFVDNQSVFFVATAASEGRVNVSPKGMNTLRIVAPDRLVWLSLSGSGNETAAHVLANDRMTLMFCSFDEIPMILRLYGSAEAIYPRHSRWEELISLFPSFGGSRQIYDMRVEEVATSCGTGVPIMELRAVRADEELEPFYAAMNDEEIHEFWSRKNTTSIDGYPTAIFDDGPEPIGRLDVAALDCADAQELGEFYQSILGGKLIKHPTADWVELHTTHGKLAFQQISDHRPPTWPDNAIPQQAHIDIDVHDLDIAEKAALAVGARKSGNQPHPENFRVFTDPAGHPFCLVRP